MHVEKPLQVLLADDHAMVRDGLRRLIEVDWPEARFDEACDQPGTLAALLRDAGALVRDFASAQALLDALGALVGAPGQVRPDVLVCDYRLDGAIDGVEVVQRLRAHWGQRIGAMILAGDTAVTDLARIDARLGTAAAQANTTLLHKPVTAQRLIGKVLALGRAER